MDKLSDLSALLQEGLKFHQSGRLEEARACYQRILAVDSKHFDAHQLAAVLEKQLGRPEVALELFDQALSISKKNAAVFNNRGATLQELKRLDEALASYAEAIRINPDYAEAFYNRGTAFKDLSRIDEALANYEEAIRIKPDYAEAFSNRGNTLHELKRWDEALASYEEAIRIKPDYANAFYNRGVTLKELKRLDEALASYEEAIRIKPDYAEAFSNRGNTLQDLKRWDEALASYDQAIRINANYADAHWNQSLALLLLGRFAEGWSSYEWRLRKENLKVKYYNGSEVAWRGEDQISGKRLFIQSEQGLGDSIQFVRYLPMVVALGGKVIFEVQKPLLTLFKSMSLPVTLVAKGEPLPDFDAYCPLMSLPYVFKTTLETIPAPIPYVFADQRSVAQWKQRLGFQHSLRVGLVWSGSAGHKNDSNRSIPLELMLPLLELPIEWHALHKEYRASDLVMLDQESRIKRHEEELNDLSDTAALVDCLDIVISVDTSVAHLAGAMGKQVWVLLPFVPDFRWLLDRDDSPWYPTVRLFRQDKRRDWGVVLSEVRDSLSALLCHAEKSVS